MSEQVQTWEIVDGLWRETTVKEEPEVQTTRFGLAPIKAEGAIIREGSIVQTPWVHHASGEPEFWETQTLYRKPEGSPICYCTTPPVKLLLQWSQGVTGGFHWEFPGEQSVCSSGPKCPTGEYYETYALAVRLDQDVLEDYGQGVYNGIEEFLRQCVIRTLDGVHRQRPCEYLFWRQMPTVHTWFHWESMSQSVAVTTRFVFANDDQDHS
jgi:hypothetical protein